jgi:predicted amidohydrolase
MPLVLSLGQMDVHIGEPDRNLARVEEWIAEAARRGSHVVVFPELWDTGYALERAAQLGSPLGAGRFARIAELARLHRIHVIGSMLELEAAPPGSPGAPSTASLRAYNTAAWFDESGEVRGIYRKLHLFRLMKEDQHLSPGRSLLALDLAWGRFGVAVCYDLRFPEMFRQYALSGAQMVIIPAQWPHPRMAHWRTLLHARAIENQMFVAACNRVGSDGSAVFGGCSAAITPWGDAIVEAGEQEVLLTAEIDLAEVTRVRREIPVFEDRRPDIYP